jgi:hypothetical protein
VLRTLPCSPPPVTRCERSRVIERTDRARQYCCRQAPPCWGWASCRWRLPVTPRSDCPGPVARWGRSCREYWPCSAGLNLAVPLYDANDVVGAQAFGVRYGELDLHAVAPQCRVFGLAVVVARPCLRSRAHFPFAGEPRPTADALGNDGCIIARWAISFDTARRLLVWWPADFDPRSRSLRLDHLRLRRPVLLARAGQSREPWVRLAVQWSLPWHPGRAHL